jgi:hypothetical protein
MGEKRNVYKILVGKCEGKRQLGSLMNRWEDNTRRDLRDIQSRDSSIGIALSYGLDERGSRVRFPVRAGNFSLHHRVQNGSGAHPASYSMGNRGSSPGGKASGA